QKGDIDGALQSCQAGLNVARSIGDEPSLIAQLVRIACRSIALRKMERVMAQGQASAPVLTDLQALLEDEEVQPLLLFAARGERAFQLHAIQELRSGNVTAAQLMGSTSGQCQIGSVDLGELFFKCVSGALPGQYAAILKYPRECGEIAGKPVEEQPALAQKLEATLPGQPVLVRLLAPAIGKVAEACRRSHAELRCVIVLVAAERYRLQHHRWPAAVDDLVKAKLLPRVPIDPYDGAPLRLRLLDDGVVIYSVGPDQTDDGSKIDRQHPIAPGSDFGYRLWNADQRRQPPVKAPPPRGEGPENSDGPP